MVTLVVVVFSLSLRLGRGLEPAAQCRERSDQLRQDGGLCFEIPPWQHQPVELERHLAALKMRWGKVTAKRRSTTMVNSEVTRYMDTVLGPFLDTYHRNIQSSYQQLTTKILKRIKDEINEAVLKKHKIYSELIKLADKLNVPEMCNEERRVAKTLASKHVSDIYKCTEEARVSIAKMGKYAEQMIGITRNHMQLVLESTANGAEAYKATKSKDHISRRNDEVEDSIKELSQAAVALGFELDLSLTNARRHNEQTCERLTTCSNEAKKSSDDAVLELRDRFYQCVYA
ncbi:uncharacterized protein LOC128677264 [Plodia interpunctella]|uniref:uncharacterized protein LOC128677264 n=1 Tax=Plodia interpunctella TaxID=58824 RepID=UPI0023689EFF|nr:uncharacterized protein LOC128677264 [Plodia interpunctella]